MFAAVGARRRTPFEQPCAVRRDAARDVHDAIWRKFAQKSRRPRGYPPLRYGDAMRDATLLPHGSQPGRGPAPSVPPTQRPAPQADPGSAPPEARGHGTLEDLPAPAQPADRTDPDRTDPDHADLDHADPDPAPAPPEAAGVPAGRGRRTLTRADWIGAALDALARDGLRAVAVEPLAERLGATKGSFYWHFRDRGALLEAAVAQWESTGTDEVLGRLAQIADPAERHRAALTEAGPESRDTRIMLALLWNADHTVIGPAVERILRKRMAFSLRLRGELGADGPQSKAAALHAYTVVLGMQMLRRAVPGMIPECGTPEEFVSCVGSLLAQPDALAFPGLA
jgi:AcrR family transcriptional regulator